MAERCWKQLNCRRSQVNLDKLLVCGQSFRWKKNGLGEWLGVMANLVWRLRQTEDGILYQVYGNEAGRATSDNFLTKQDSLKQNGLTNETFLENADSSHLNLGKNNDQNMSTASSSLLPDMLAVKTEPAITHTRQARKRAMNDSNQSITIVKFESQGHIELLKRQRKVTKKSKNVIQTINDSSNHTPDIIRQFHPGKSFQPKLDLKNEAHNATDEEGKHEKLLRDYFQLDIDIEKLYHEWSAKDPHFSKVGASLEGIRILRQDPTENLLSFVCSSNNHISRIASMVEKLCVHYGELITMVDGEKYYSIPSFHSLSGDHVESHLRQSGFGYRAKFISSIAKSLIEQKGDGWLDSLRHCSYEEAKKELLSLMGVGPKVADCVCLMSLDKPGAVPVDTHVWQITVQHYMAHLKAAKSLTNKIYNDIGDFYRNLWGPYAGWAHSVLFTADLKQNKSETKSGKRPSEQKTTNKKKVKG